MLENWHSEVKELLENQNYQALANYYEELVENNPDEISNYWYLGLAYLLTGQEESAQLTWFTAFNEIDEAEIDHQTATLTDILAQEVDRQLSLNNYQLAWLIRSHIRELNPDNFSNLLQLICLDIQLNNSDIDQFETWQLEDLCQSISIDNIPTDVLIKSIHVILYLPCPESLAFARFCLGKKDEFELILAMIVNLAVKMAYNHRYASYAADLLKICLEFQPNNLTILNAFHIFSNDAQDYENALITAHQFLANSDTLPQKTFALYQIIHTCLKCHDWKQLQPFFEQFIELINQYIKQPEEIKINFIRQSFLIVNQPLLYLQDNPEQNRYLINNIGQIFQSLFRKETTAIVKPYNNRLIADRPLKIGYLGSTFRSHSVGWLCRWLIHYQDQDKFPSYIYSITSYGDQITEQWFKEKVTKFHRFDRNLDEAITQIQEDQIDILIDLDSLTLDLACQVMALKPAPIQVTWLGLDASGVPAIDYFIADPYVLPDNAQDYYSEKIWRLPDTYLGIDGFEIGVPTLRREDLEIPQEGIIFLNVQNKQKLHPENIRQQMKIIKAVPNSYLLIKERNTKKMARQFFEQLAQEEGVELGRIRFLSPNKTELEHRANLTIADIVLDTYPYNGSTTTLETLWMEVPIVTRVGEQFAARNSYTYMMNVGITEGIAWNEEEYVEWGIKLGTDENLRKEISWKLRKSKKTSPLWNGKQFAREMEKAYQQMWETYLKKISEKN